MAELLTYPDPRLQIVCEPVPEGWFGTKKLNLIFLEMWQIMKGRNGVGLAAPQIGIPYQIMITHVPGSEVVEICNPELEGVKRFGKFMSKDEGCLSFPGRRVSVPRWRRVKVRGRDWCGHPVTVGGKMLRAAALQHECEHLQGITLGDYMELDWRTDERETTEDSELPEGQIWRPGRRLIDA